MGHRLEDPKQRTYAVNDDQVIAVGDMLFLDTDDVKAASQFTWDTNIATTQKAFSKVFVGVSADRKEAAETEVDEVGVYRAGLIEFSCAAAQFEVGDYVGPAKASGNALESQKVVAVTGPSMAIGKVAKRYTSNTTSVLVEIFPKSSSGQLSVDDLQEELGGLGAASISADAIVDGTTNKAFTATEKTKLGNIEASATADQTGGEIVTLLEALSGSSRLSADGIKDGTTNKVFTATEKTKLGNVPTFFYGSFLVSAGEASANTKAIPTGLGEPASFYIVQIYRLGAVVTGDVVVANNSGSLSVSDGDTFVLTENDVVNVLACKV